MKFFQITGRTSEVPKDRWIIALENDKAVVDTRLASLQAMLQEYQHLLNHRRDSSISFEERSVALRATSQLFEKFVQMDSYWIHHGGQNFFEENLAKITYEFCSCELIRDLASARGRDR